MFYWSSIKCIHQLRENRPLYDADWSYPITKDIFFLFVREYFTQGFQKFISKSFIFFICIINGVFSSILSSNCLLFMHVNMSFFILCYSLFAFCILLLSELISSLILWCFSVLLSHYLQLEVDLAHHPASMSLVVAVGLIAVASTFCVMIESKRNCGHPFLIPNHGEKLSRAS